MKQPVVVMPSKEIDLGAFDAILELDDENEGGFVKALVEEYFSLADSTSKSMNRDLYGMDYDNLAFLAERLWGSSATIGFVAIASICHTISRDATAIRDAPDAESMQKQRLGLRQRLQALNNQIKTTEDEATRYYQDVMHSKKIKS